MVHRPRIAHVIDGLGAGGAEALLVTTLRHLDRTQREHVVVTVFRPGSPRYPARWFWDGALRELGVPVIGLDCRNRRDTVLATRTLARWLRSERIDLVHSHLFHANLMTAVAARNTRIPLVSSLHTLSYEPEVVGTYAEPNSWKHSAARAAEAVLLRVGRSHVIAVGRAVADSAIRRLHLDPDRVVVIHNAVDVRAIDEAPEPAALFRELGLAPGARLLVDVGRVIPSKRQLDAVRALAQLAERHPSAHLALVGPIGSSDYASRIERAARDAGIGGRVHLVDARRDVATWLRAADVFVFPSEFEGLPLALAEAAAAGCAIVASDIHGNREVVPSDEMGKLVPVGDVDAIARAMDAYLTDDAHRRRVGAAVRVHGRASFGPARAAAELERIYDDGLRARHQPFDGARAPVGNVAG
jgi:glycosyltransferase involved in cell wall biosynthesis